MKNINKKIIIISITLSLIVTYLIYNYLKSLDDELKEIEYMEILVASQDINPRQQITDIMIEKIKINKDSYVVNSLQNPEDIIGMFTKGKILKGEVIPSERLFKNEERDLSIRVPKGKRAISVLTNEITGVADLIKPGDYVDVYVVLDEYTDKVNNYDYPKTGKILLQNILVLAVSKEQNRTDEDRFEVPGTYPVTLAVLPKDGEKLILGDEMGTIKLAIRPLHEKDIINTNGTIRNDL